MLQDTETHETFSDKLRFIFIELPCFKKTEEDCNTDFERWIYVLKNMEILDRMPFKAYKAAFEKLEKITDIAALSKEDRMKYDESIKVYRDIKATLAYSKKEGYEDGITKGREEGRAEGRMEERITVARNMKSRGMPIELIADITQVPLKELENL
jgi:predicted transposase/invertase (TIGR01784 family)